MPHDVYTCAMNLNSNKLIRKLNICTLQQQQQQLHKYVASYNPIATYISYTLQQTAIAVSTYNNNN